MKGIVNIEKRVIGAIETNAVNARDLHKSLGVKQDFSDWIKRQLKVLGLEINVDYIPLPLKEERKKQGFVAGANKIDYIITTDTAKHISMASRTQKGKEVRDYFIAVEKEYMATANAGGAEILNQIIPVLQQMMQMMSVILKNQEEQVSKNLTPEQLGKIRGAVNETKIPVQAFFYKECESEVTKAIYSKLNNELGVPSYIYIPAAAFEEALTIIKEIQDKYKKKLQDRRMMKLDLSMGEDDEK